MALRHYVTSESSPYFSEEIFTLSDGQEIALDWCIGHTSQVSTPVIVVFPGIIGTLREHISMGKRAFETGEFVIVVFNRRGHRIPLRNPNLNSLGQVSDAQEVLDHIRKIGLKPGTFSELGFQEDVGYCADI